MTFHVLLKSYSTLVYHFTYKTRKVLTIVSFTRSVPPESDHRYHLLNKILCFYLDPAN